MADFTPGQWEVWDYDTPDTRDTGFGGMYKRIKAISSTAIAEVASFIGNPADARLIAAAPELFEAVFELLYYAREVCDNNGGESETRGRAPRIWKEIQEYETLLQRVRGKEEAQ